MEKSIQQMLIELNISFYTEFAESFSATRGRLQPGVISITADIKGISKILDLGCGNGQFLFNLARNRFQGTYVGVDFSIDLLEIARELNKPLRNIDMKFEQFELSNPDWSQQFEPDSFDLITSFATLHHIPGKALHLQFLKQVLNLLKPDGKFLFSVWQFLNSERLQKRVLPWETVGLNQNDLEPGDTLLDWRAEHTHKQIGHRYVHLFNELELTDLAEKSGFKCLSQFYSDGREGNLALYQEWVKLPH
ncbi:MAG: class I SAM-dependent methyltransferase [Anaerolineaceae bacterium]|nr:class I SAM-dependent methyltransferase [Anaerolineaceae bacterium]